MTLRQWFDFNEKILNYQDVYVTLFRTCSLQREDVMLHTKMDLADAVDLFGDKSLQRVGVDIIDSQCYLRFLLWPCIKEASAKNE